MGYKIRVKIDGQIPVCLEVINKNEIQEYQFSPVTPIELAQLRLSTKPGIVYKKAGKLYYAAVPGNLKLSGQDDTLGTHLCGKNCTMVCKGCRRTTDLTVSYQERYGKKFLDAVKASWRIEKYAFIPEGIEAFNMSASNDAFIVLQCNNYKVSPPKEKGSKSLHELKLGLANFVWDDFDGGVREMRLRIISQAAKNSKNSATPYTRTYKPPF